MGARRVHGAIHQLPGIVCLGALFIATTVAGCGAAGAKAAKPQDCGTGHTAANTPVEIVLKVNHGSVSCSTAMALERSYAQAIREGKAPGNGGGGPVSLNGWTCQGLPTPELLKTGETSKCTKDGEEIVAILKTS